MIKSFNLVLVTEEAMVLEEGNELSLSLAMGIISSYLEGKGIQVCISDTNKIASKHKYTKEELDLISNIYIKKKVLDYVKGNEDKELDQVAKMFLDEEILSYDAFGISVGADFSMMQVHLGIVLGAYIKRMTKGQIFIGGNNISYLYIFKDFYKELLEAMVANFEFVIKGPGEKVIYEIIQGINEGKSVSDFENTDGLIRLVDGTVKCNKERDPIVLAPNWDRLELDDYSYPFVKNQRENESIYYRFPLALTNKVVSFNKMNMKERKLLIPYIFNYNCTYKCAFCTQSDTDRSGLIVGEVEKVLDDIEGLSKKYHSNFFYFLNNYFPSSMNYIRTFRDGLKKRNLQIYWSDCGRVNGLTKEKIELLYESGCRKLVFGFESGNQKILDLIDKRIDLREVLQVLKWCKEVGIWADLEVIIGLPYEREEEFLSTYNFLKEHRDLINNFWLNEYFVVPNSLIGRYPENYGVKLLKERTSYEALMKINRCGFLKKNYMNLTSNARLWGFDEINAGDSRNYGQMKLENEEKMARLAKLRNPEFNQLFDFYKKMIQFRKETE